MQGGLGRSRPGTKVAELSVSSMGREALVTLGGNTSAHTDLRASSKESWGSFGLCSVTGRARERGGPPCRQDAGPAPLYCFSVTLDINCLQLPVRETVYYH